jgi:prepilin-type N-terminal cleavage/methylation domain-containing protein
MMRINNTRRRAFSLMEMAIVIAIIALVMGFAVSLGTNAIESAERTSTQERLAVLKRALEDYAKANGYLPCPYDRTLLPADPNFGTAILGGMECLDIAPGLVILPSPFDISIGGVPVRTLGLPDAYAEDAWGNKFTYAVSSLHIYSPAQYILEDGRIEIAMGDVGAADWLLAPSIARDNDPNSVVLTYTTGSAGATYVLFSHGPDGRGAFPLNASTVPVVNICDDGSHRQDTPNCDDVDAVFFDNPYNDGDVSSIFFDDYVVWGSNALARPEIRPAADLASGFTAGATCAGKCEAWCAPCAGDAAIANIPAPPSAFIQASSGSNGAKLCKKIITSTSPCTASCLWSGQLSAPSVAGEYIVRCP